MTDMDTEIYALSESSVTVVFGNEINRDLAEKVLAFDRAVHAAPFEGFITTIPAYATLTVCYDPKTVLKRDLKSTSCFDKVAYYLSMLTVSSEKIENAGRKLIVPVCYGGEYGPDIDLVAAHCGLSVEEVIAIHSASCCTVYMIGFVPGFAYMGGMDSRLSTPRKEQPRSTVIAGSIGIAGGQTGIYPLAIPGGWQIIGRTPLTLFDSGRPQPSLLAAGDEITFTSISNQEFQSLLS